MTPDPHGRRLGDYFLIRCIGDTGRSMVWLAEQISVRRPVVVEELLAGAGDERAVFLADARAKAAVDHPRIASVLEAVDVPACCFFATERLPGTDFAARLAVGEPFRPAELVRHLRQVAEANLHLEHRGLASAALDLEHIHLDEHEVVRLANRAHAGQREEGDSARDVAHLGAALQALVADGHPGASRLHTLLAWMRGEGLVGPLEWKRVRDYCDEIEAQLKGPTAKSAEVRTSRRRRERIPAAAWIGVATVVLLAVLAIVSLRGARPKPEPTPAPSPLPAPVLIPAGAHVGADGIARELPAFRIGAHEVTIGEYAAFLDTLDVLAETGRERAFDHPDQPAEKSGHVPDDWGPLISAARSRGVWNRLAVTPDTPVVGVDWWDAAAYSRWKSARLPTQDEWVAALRHGSADVDALPPAVWLPVGAPTSDVTPAGLRGMAGSVAEWTAEPAVNPANPLGARQWVIIGGSYLQPDAHALAREWVHERSLRRPDLGFRLVYPAE